MATEIYEGWRHIGAETFDWACILRPPQPLFGGIQLLNLNQDQKVPASAVDLLSYEDVGYATPLRPLYAAVSKNLEIHAPPDKMIHVHYLALKANMEFIVDVFDKDGNMFDLEDPIPLPDLGPPPPPKPKFYRTWLGFGGGGHCRIASTTADLFAVTRIDVFDKNPGLGSHNLFRAASPTSKQLGRRT